MPPTYDLEQLPAILESAMRRTPNIGIHVSPAGFRDRISSEGIRSGTKPECDSWTLDGTNSPGIHIFEIGHPIINAYLLRGDAKGIMLKLERTIHEAITLARRHFPDRLSNQEFDIYLFDAKLARNLNPRHTVNTRGRTFNHVVLHCDDTQEPIIPSDMLLRIRLAGSDVSHDEIDSRKPQFRGKKGSVVMKQILVEQGISDIIGNLGRIPVNPYGTPHEFLLRKVLRGRPRSG